jgi:thioredoxin-like negative regulator of GroEL
MMPSEVNWLPPLIVLALGLLFGVLLVWRLRTGARPAEAAPVGGAPALPDLEARRDALIAELRELELDASKANTAELARTRFELEIEAARVLMALDRAQAKPGLKAKRAEAKGEAAAIPAAGSALKGFLWGVGSMGALGLLLYLASQSTDRRAPAESATSGAPTPAEMAQSDPEIARLKGLVEKNPGDLEARLELARRSLLRDDMMGTFNETRVVLERRPDDPRALTYQAVVRLAMGQAKGAEDMLKRAIAAQPGLEDAHVYLMLVYTETGRSSEAEAALAAAQKQLPTEAASLKDILARMRSEVAARGGPMPAESAENPHATLDKGSAPAAAAPQAMVQVVAQPGAARGVSGVVDLDPSASPHHPPSAVIWVLLRPAGQRSAAPVAAKRLPATFPQQFSIGASDSMTGGPIPDRVLIEARLDADGNPATRDPGDPLAILDSVALGASDVRLRLAPQK